MKAYKIRLKNNVEADGLQLFRQKTLRGKEWEKPEGINRIKLIFWLENYAEMNGATLQPDEELRKAETLEEIVKFYQKQAKGIKLTLKTLKKGGL